MDLTYTIVDIAADPIIVNEINFNGVDQSDREYAAGTSEHDIKMDIFAAFGLPTTTTAKYPPIGLLTGEKNITSDQEWEVVSSIVSRPESIGVVLSNMFAYILGAAKSTASAGSPTTLPQFRVMVTALSNGDITEFVPATNIADTAGATKVFQCYTPKTMISGYGRYILEARLNGAQELVFGDLSVTLLETMPIC